jgi:uncharacterized protein YihD (DUF1040 family)
MRVDLPSGISIQAKGLSSAIDSSDDRRPDWAVYFDDSWKSMVSWPSVFITWPDFGVPAPDDERRLFDSVHEMRARATQGECVEMGCTGGTGRTGTALACLVVLEGFDPAAAIAWVRSNYHRYAIETDDQEALVDRFASHPQGTGGFRKPGAGETAGTLDLAALRRRLLDEADRWTSELDDWSGSRATLWYGIFDKACKRLEELVAEVTDRWVKESGGGGLEIVLKVGQGKPFNRLTLGQLLDVLRQLLKKRLVAKDVTQSQVDRLERLVSLRNDFEHGRLDYDEGAIEVTIRFLHDLQAFCESPLVRPDVGV